SSSFISQRPGAHRVTHAFPTRRSSDLKFAQAVAAVSGYPPQYDYQSVAHVRLSRLPIGGRHLQKVFDFLYPGWEEAVDWSLLLERESFFYLVLAGVAFVLLLLLRQRLAWYADQIGRAHV